MALLLIVACMILLCSASVSVAATTSDLKDVFKFVQEKGKELNAGYPGIEVKFFEIREPIKDGVELRLYTVFISIIDGDKIIPQQIRIVHEVWENIENNKVRIAQRMIADENLDGEVDSGAAVVQIQSSESEVLGYEFKDFSQDEAQTLLDETIKLLITRYSLRAMKIYILEVTTC